MSSVTDTASTVRLYGRLLKEVHRLGVNKKSSEYSILKRAIRNLIPNNDLSLVMSEAKSSCEEDYCTGADLPDGIEKGKAGSSKRSSRPEVQTPGIISVDWQGNHQIGCPYYPCILAYSSIPELREHMREHTRENQGQRYRCRWPNCGETLNSSDELTVTRHTMRHYRGRSPSPIPSPTRKSCSGGPSGTKPPSKKGPKKRPREDAVCDVCHKEFNSVSAVKRHYVIHTGEKAFKCTWEGCGKAFNQRAHLTKHAKLHTGKPVQQLETPYKCTWRGCGKAFSDREQLLYHINIHS